MASYMLLNSLQEMSDKNIEMSNEIILYILYLLCIYWLLFWF